MAYEDEDLEKRREQHRQERAFLAKQRKLLRIGFIITGVTMVLCVATLLITGGLLRAQLPSGGNPSMEATTLPPTEGTAAPTVPDTVIHLVAGGDVNVTDKTVAAGTAVSGFDFTDVFMDVAPVLAAGDLTSVNFEGSIFGAPYGSENRSAPVEMLKALKNAGVDLVQAANSYTVYNGLDGLQKTLQGIRDTGMDTVGAYLDAAEFRKTGGFIIREVQGIRIAIVAFTKGMDGMGLPAGSEDCVNLLYEDFSSTYQKVDTDGITAVLRAAEKYQPDVTVALLHWGSEYNDQLSKTQESITKLMLKEGVDAIVGTHSHYVQKVSYDEETGTLVAYSLGDLLGDGERGGTEYSILLDMEITKDGATGEVKITGFDYTPIFLADETASGGSLRLLRIREAMTAYEESCIGSVSKETYDAMKNALSRIENRVNGK